MATTPTSYRIDQGLKERLASQAAAEGLTERAMLERLVAEGLDTLAHPGIVYRNGPTGRRAALAVGPDVWEVVSALRHTEARRNNESAFSSNSSTCIPGTSVRRSTMPLSTARRSRRRSRRTTVPQKERNVWPGSVPICWPRSRAVPHR